MRKRSMTILAAAALAASLTVGGCGSKSPEAGGKFGGEKGLTVAPSTEAETEAETEPELDEETMDLIKYNVYIELNNDILEVLNNIDYYFVVVGDGEEFALLPDTGLTYGYRIVGHFTKCGYKLGQWWDMVWMEKMLGPHPEQPEPFIPAGRL